jgi:uncharacterized protein YmfQ (DUF2313 family)
VLNCNIPVDAEVSALQKHLPTGKAWDAFQIPGKRWYRVLKTFGSSIGEMRGALCALKRELDPRTTEQLLPEWEAALSLPDPCFPPAATIDQRRSMLMLRLSKRRWTTIQDWADLCTLFGYQVRITPGALIQGAATYPYCYPIRYDHFPKAGRFRIYIDVLNYDFYGYGKYAYPFPYQAADTSLDILKCIIDRIRPSNVIVIWNSGITPCGNVGGFVSIDPCPVGGDAVDDAGTPSCVG